MLQAFVDDSANHSGDRRLLLAGYILSAEAWTQFGADWKVALERPPALKSLHMTKSFYGWSAEQRQAKLDLLASVIQKHRPISIECSISKRDFDEVLAFHTPHDLRHPYFYCFYGLVIQAGRLLNELALDEQLEFVFDMQGNVGTNAALWYLPMKGLQSPEIQAVLGGPPIFRSDEEALPLQAADMLAWYRRIVRESSCTAANQRIAHAIIFTHAEVHIPRDMLERWAVAFSALPDIEQTKGPKGSVKNFMSTLVRIVPEDRVSPVLVATVRRAERLRGVKAVLIRLKLGRVWKWLTKRKIRIH